MTADEHAPNRKNKKKLKRISSGKKKFSSPRNGEITDRKSHQSINKNQSEQPGRSLGGNTRSHGLDYSQQTNSDQVPKIGNDGNLELNQEVNQFPGSSQFLHQQYQHLGLHHQLIMRKYDAEIDKLTLEVQTLRDRMRKNSRKIKNLKAKLSSIETIPAPLEPQQMAQPQREPAKQLKKKKNRGSGSKPKKTPTRIVNAPTQCPVCMKTFKLKRNFRKHQNKTKRGLEDSCISDILSASPANTAQTNVSPEQRDSSNTVFEGVSRAQTYSNSHKNMDPAITSNTPTTKSIIFPKKLNESFQDISPNKMKRESEMVSLLSKHVDVPGIKIKQNKNSCTSCLSSFDDEDLLTEHIESSCPKNLYCQFCKKRFIRIKSLNLHLKTHEDIYKCPSCKKSFKCLSALQVHKRRPCEVLECGKFYRKDNHFERHTKKIHKNSLKPFVCNLCSKSFAKEKLLEKHFRTHPVCIKCQLSFKTGAYLESHIKGFHAQIQTRVCRYCCKMINQKKWKKHGQNCELNQQQRGTCFYCNKICKTSVCLKRHIESKHGGIQRVHRRNLVPLRRSGRLMSRLTSYVKVM